MKRARTTAEAVELGRELLAVKQHLGHGHFLSHLQERGVGEDTARRWMLIAQQIEEMPELLELRLSMAYRVATASPAQQTIAASIVAIKRQWREQDIEEAIVRSLQAQGIWVKRQVSCGAGRIDLVTLDALYEVELFLSRSIFFHALGQVLLYRQAFDPTRKAIIVGLADPGSDITDLTAYARQLNVEVQFWTIPGDEARRSESTTALGMLREVAQVLAHIERSADELPARAEVADNLDAIEQSVQAIRRAMRKH